MTSPEAKVDTRGASRSGRVSAAGIIGGAILIFWLLVALVGPFLAPYGQADIVSNDNFAGASAVDRGAWCGSSL